MGVTKPQDERKKEKQVKQKVEKKIERKRKVIEGIRGIVRVVDVDLAGERKVRNALLGIKGIGKSLSIAIPKAANINSEVMIGSLTDEQIEILENVIKNPSKYGIPSNMLNRKKDPVLGIDRHIVGSELTITNKSDIDLMKKIRSYKGIRHELGLPVRGQRTRSSFRTGMILGVAKKKLVQKPAGAPVVTPTAGAQPAKASTPQAAPAKIEKKEEKK